MRSIPEFDEAYYAANYGNYRQQNPASKLQWYLSLVEPHLATVDPPQVLDIGCAFASFLSICPPHWDRFGVDMSFFGVQAAAKRLEENRVITGSAEAIGLDHPFDLITAFDTLEHVPDLDKVKGELQRLLRPQGYFLFVVPVFDGPTGPIISLLDKDPTHVHKMARQFWLTWAGDDFDLLDWWGMYRYLLPGGVYLHWPTHALRKYTPAIAVVCRARN